MLYFIENDGNNAQCTINYNMWLFSVSGFLFFFFKFIIDSDRNEVAGITSLHSFFFVSLMMYEKFKLYYTRVNVCSENTAFQYRDKCGVRQNFSDIFEFISYKNRNVKYSRGDLTCADILSNDCSKWRAWKFASQSKHF